MQCNDRLYHQHALPSLISVK
uniref:Uncharacterized protein n=1 Tax=Rhizophora mucronata TaxID=61149 RepID=A0A2P2NU07_RHIMU